MKNYNRFIWGALFGMTAEYLYRVQFSIWALFCLIWIGLMIITDLVVNKNYRK